MDGKRRLGPLPMIFPMPALLVGTFDDDGTANAMTAAWAAICCQSPPCAGVAIRSSRLTFANLVARRAFTLNVPRAADAAAVDFLGIVSGRDNPGKLARAGFEAGPGAVVEAPILVGCPVNVECRLLERLDLGTHSWFVGEIVEVHVDEACLDAGGKVDLAALDPLVYATSRRHYHRVGADVGRAFEMGRTLGDDRDRER